MRSSSFVLSVGASYHSNVTETRGDKGRVTERKSATSLATKKEVAGVGSFAGGHHRLARCMPVLHGSSVAERIKPSV